ncbi:radical SAM protein [Candidatus Bathyarchaeota archaeon]|nr:radical SAM protein [Candidatus Bathyarchaeota archaeon]
MSTMSRESKYSFSAANTIPLKIFFQQQLIESCASDRKVLPIHLQLNPTNVCTFNCPVCSCSARDKKQELPIENLVQFLETFKKLGGKSITVTGGGEPTMYRGFRRMVFTAIDNGLELGLVTNAIQLKKPDVNSVLGCFTWIRISSTDSLPDQLQKIGSNIVEWFYQISKSVHAHPKVDWAFSHVQEKKTNPSQTLAARNFVRDLILFAMDHDFTHVRVVNDIYIADELEEEMQSLEKSMKAAHLDLSRVNFQSRSEWTKGTKRCLISLAKPVLAADGFLYPCCGTQYALANPSRDYERSMRLGRMEEFGKIINEQRCFDGSVCSKCYYSSYNEILGVLVDSLKHRDFI